MKSFLDFIFGLHRQIAHITRFNTTPLTIKETVAEHSYFVTHYARLIADYLEKKGYIVDKLKVADMALVHDNEESWSGDIIYMVKKEDKQISSAMSKIADAAIQIVLSPLDEEIQDYWHVIWLQWQHGNSIEKQIVLVADMLSVVIFIAEQIKMGNKYCEKILKRIFVRWKKTIEHYKAKWMQEILSILIKKLKFTNFELKEDDYKNELWGKE